MSQHTPWSPEQAEKWAKQYALSGGDSYSDLFEGFLAGMAKAAEMIEARGEAFYVHKIEEWKFSWMNVIGTDEEDRKNYSTRAFGVDANMIYDLARRLVGVRPIADSDESVNQKETT